MKLKDEIQNKKELSLKDINKIYKQIDTIEIDVHGDLLIKIV